LIVPWSHWLLRLSFSPSHLTCSAACIYSLQNENGQAPDCPPVIPSTSPIQPWLYMVPKFFRSQSQSPFGNSCSSLLQSWYLPNEHVTYKTDYWSHAQKVTCHPCHVTKMCASKSLSIETSVWPDDTVTVVCCYGLPRSMSMTDWFTGSIDWLLTIEVLVQFAVRYDDSDVI